MVRRWTAVVVDWLPLLLVVAAVAVGLLLAAPYPDAGGAGPFSGR